MYLFNISVNLRFSGGNYTIFPALPAIIYVHFIIVWFQSTLANYIFLLNKQKLKMGVTLQNQKIIFYLLNKHVLSLYFLTKIQLTVYRSSRLARTSRDTIKSSSYLKFDLSKQTRVLLST